MVQRLAKVVVLACSPALVALGFGQLRAQEDPDPQPPVAAIRAIPGITADDVFPNGCVDCHVIIPDGSLDVRISTLMRTWYDSVDAGLLDLARASLGSAGRTLVGRHPRVEEALADIPADCMRCHGSRAVEAPPFSRLLHRVHLVGGPENLFLSMFQGECTHCHKLDPATGRWSLASGSEAGVREP